MSETPDPAATTAWRPILGRGFHLEDSRRAQSLLALVGLLTLGILHQRLTSPLRLVASSPGLWITLAVVTGAAALASMGWLRRGAVPAREATGISMVLALVVGAALWQVVPWLERATDESGGREVIYLRAPEREVRWTAHTPGPPDLRFRRDHDFWDSLPGGQPFGFRLYRGVLGTWVLDEAPIAREVDKHRAFFKGLEQGE